MVSLPAFVDARSFGPVASLTRRSAPLWVLAVCSFGGGDLLTTWLGLRTPHVAEAGAVPVVLLGSVGFLGLVALKVAAFGAGAVVWRFVPHPHRLAVPVAFAASGVVITGWNAAVLAVQWTA